MRLMILRGTMAVHDGWVIRRRTALGTQGGAAPLVLGPPAPGVHATTLVIPGDARREGSRGPAAGSGAGCSLGLTQHRMLARARVVGSRGSPPRDGLKMRPTTNSVVHEHCPFFLRRRFFISADRRRFEGRRAVPESLSSAVRSVLMSTPFTRQRRTRARAHTRAQTQTRKHTSTRA